LTDIERGAHLVIDYSANRSHQERVGYYLNSNIDASSFNMISFRDVPIE
jgi:hypothetical protein